MQREFLNAICNGRENEVKKILEEKKDIDVNCTDCIKWTALHSACNYGHEKIVAMLLAHPNIDVNQKSNSGMTPFSLACFQGRTTCARLLLKDDRVKVNEPNSTGNTPLWYAAHYGYIEIIKWWVASEREMCLGQSGNENNDAIGIAKDLLETKVVCLLERFRDHPNETRYEMRVKLECFDLITAEMFALMVFLSDGLLKDKEGKMSKAARFFRITKELPLELQMILCHRVAGSMGTNIPVGRSELAFRKLARGLLLLN
jgi:hypothetical protein